MKVLGITGGVGSGKSLVLSYLEQKNGVVVYEADHLARMEQKPGTQCFKEIVAYFGEEILTKEGELDRKKLGTIVFQDSQKLEALNQIVHPLVREHILELMEMHRAEGMKLFVLEAAILLESNYETLCDQMWFIYCEEQVRIERLRSSRNYSEELFHHISGQQMTEAVFRDKCHVVIDNSKDEKHLLENIDKNLDNLI